MTTQDTKIFFAIIRAAIWTDSEGHPLPERLQEVAGMIPDHYDWDTMMRAFSDHALITVVSHAIMCLPEDKRPDLARQKRIMPIVASYVRKRRFAREEVCEVMELLRAKGFAPVLLKGEGLALLYPSTCIRPIGDIDICVSRQDYAEAKQCLAAHCGCNPDSCKEDDIHVQMHKGRSEYELHRAPFAPAIPVNAAKTLEWASAQVAPEACRKVSVLPGRPEVMVPNPYFNLFLVFDHMLKHIVHETPSLRQYLDLALSLKYAVECGCMDEARFVQDLRTYSSLPLWQVISGVLHYQLGMDKAMIPAWNEALARKSGGYFLRYMTDSGNFGRGTARKRFVPIPALRKLQHALYFTRFPLPLMREMVKHKVRGYFLKKEDRYEKI